jgi:starvation-inducible DNA-binding protein
MRVHVSNPRGRPLRELDVATAREHEEDLLDEALAESFPASDPPSPYHGSERVSARVPRDERASMQTLLHQCLAEAIDAYNHARQAHWDLGGADFSALHELFDDFARHLDESTDSLAERSAHLFGASKGGSELVAEEAPREEELEALPPGKSHLDVFASRLAHFRDSVREAGEMARTCSEKELGEILARIGRQVDRDLLRLEEQGRQARAR